VNAAKLSRNKEMIGMSTWMRNLSVLSVAVLLAVASTGCDDDDNNFNPGSTTTSTTTTTIGGTTLSTTTTSTSTTSITATTSTTTTTVTGGGSCDCDVTFGVTNTETLGALQYDTNYAAANGGFDGAGGAVACTRLAGDFAAFNDIEASSNLSSAFISAAGFTGPIDVASCGFTGNSGTPPVAGDFAITITDQSKPDFSPASATVEITDISCVCTTPSTTTTVGGTTTTVGGGGTLYTVTFDLDDAVTAGALQFEVDYAAAGGDFVGSGAGVTCTSPLSAGGAFVSFNDVDASTQLNFAAVAIAGFTGPTTVANCTFDAATAPTAGDFVITVVDASAPDLSPIVPLPVVSVSAITPQ
jgi:hypothetical protein